MYCVRTAERETVGEGVTSGEGVTYLSPPLFAQGVTFPPAAGGAKVLRPLKALHGGRNVLRPYDKTSIVW
jgi:hypothetical protein